MGDCCSRRRAQGDEPGPSPSRPQYDSQGYAVEESPVSGIRRRLPRTLSENLTPLTGKTDQSDSGN